MNVIRRPNTVFRFECHEEFIVFIIEKKKIYKLPLNCIFYVPRYLNIFPIGKHTVRG